MESETSFLPLIIYQVNGVVWGEIGDCGLEKNVWNETKI